MLKTTKYLGVKSFAEALINMECELKITSGWKNFMVIRHSIKELLAKSMVSMHSRHLNYASPTSGEAYRDRWLTTNFALWVEIFCVSTCFHVRIPKPCLSVRPSVCPSVCLSAPREKKSSLVSSISVLQ